MLWYYWVKRCRTCKGLKVGGTFSGCTDTIDTRVSPIGPAGYILQGRVVLTVFKVAVRDQSRSSTGINDIVECDDSALRGWTAGVVGSDWAFAREVERGDLGILENLDSL